MKTVLVIGGGVTGLSAMYELQKWKKEHGKEVRLVLAEASDELGGKIRTVKTGDFIMESGADSIVARKANTMSFIKDLGLESKVVLNDTGRSYIFTDGELKPIPEESVFGIPASIESLAKSTLVSAEGKVEALKDFYTKNQTFTKNDSVGSFLEYCFGKELVEKQIAPVLSGVYSGKLSDLTIASTLPYLLDYKEEYGSIIKGFAANKDKFQSGERKFLSFKNGLSSLIDAYEQKLEDVEIFKNTKALSIKKTGDCYQVTFSNHEVIEVDQLMLGIPHSEAEKLLMDIELKKEFSQLKNSSMISVYIGFNIQDQVLPLEGTGFITADNNEISCNACTWTSRKWKHTSKKGNLLVRVFYKSSNPAYGQLQEMSKDGLLQFALSDLQKSLGIEAEPVVSLITDWSGTMPNYSISHPETVQAIERQLEVNYPGVFIAGCSYYGVGIPDCIENGKRTAEKITSSL
ncbi:protoporphyrinogen oxidase [Niallia endozanthoxylica]|uniref:Coproporphyrinogen III oxidase n=1 Tax=Niallia endozanthoxylica TaxID=2036016 RepID=A0A5J5H768_9BACI|nr:protoporphyrinogen oxidase [Niallia endozanthoxylica]KAA9016489.1 protoporphyrinogen oxidase [Niallia endozanthoxylica]